MPFIQEILNMIIKLILSFLPDKLLRWSDRNKLKRRSINKKVIKLIELISGLNKTEKISNFEIHSIQKFFL